MTGTMVKERLLVSPDAPTQVLKVGEKNFVPLEKGMRYRVVPANDASATLKEDVEAIREVNDLTIRYPDGTEIFVPDYYGTCAGGSCSLAIGDGTAAGYVLNPDAPVLLGVGPEAVDLTAPSLVLPDVASALVAAPQPVTGSPLVVPAEAAGGWGVWTWVGIGGGVALAAAAGGGGGGGGGTTGGSGGTGSADTIKPTLIGKTPADNATAVLIGSNIVLTFSETVVAGTGNIVISNGTDTRTIAVTDTSQVTFSGNTVTINPAADLQDNKHYNVQMLSGVIKDAAGNHFLGITTNAALDFNTQELGAPTLVSKTPADNATAVLIGSNIVLTFSETVVAGTGNIVISNGTDTRTISVTDTSQVTISGNTVTINPAADLQGNSHYNVQMASGVIEDASGTNFFGITSSTALDFDTQDLAGPTLSGSTPADNATAVLIGSNIVLTFSETVAAGTGNIVISNGTDTRTISVSDSSQVTFSGSTVTINPTANLQGNSTYNVQMASGVITDALGNDFAGIASDTLVNFDTQDLAGPTLVSSTPGDNATAVPVDSDIVLVFNEAVMVGNGNIVISNGTDMRTISVLNASQVTVSGNTVTINPTADLQNYGHYNVQIASGVLRDTQGNLFAGITNNTVLDFETSGTPIELSSIAIGLGGFAINGQAVDERSGSSVSSAGDVNGDGLADLIVGAPVGTPSAGFSAGRTYVVFGGTFAAVNLSTVAGGTGGFVISGQAASDASGASVSAAGDVNGDGLADLIVGAPNSDPSGNSLAGRSYVVFGKTRGTSVDLSAVAAGTGGFVINGQAAGDESGYSVSSAGDVNGDGFADLVIGAHRADPPAGTSAGRTYVVFGKSGTTAVDLSAVSAGEGGFLIRGQAGNELSGMSVSGAGDVNGDGLADMIVGARVPPEFSPTDTGRSYVVFGKTGNSVVDLSAVAAGVGGFGINGQLNDRSGVSVSNAGDVNGDGLADLVVGGHGADGLTGRSYVVFGKTDGSAVNLSAVGAGTGGFVMIGESSDDRSGYSVSTAGDMNGDGLADLLVGAYGADPGGATFAGRSYVVFGKTDSSAVELSQVLTGAGGFALNGEAVNDFSGYSVSAAGDVNGDGLSDLIVGALYSDPAAGVQAGRSYVIFGATAGLFAQTAVDQYGTFDHDTFTDAGTAQTIVTSRGNDTVTATAASVLYGGDGEDSFVISATMITALQSAMGTGGNIDRLARIDGGGGIDRISLSGSGKTLNLTQIANQSGGDPDGGSRIDSIETIDLTGSGNNSLILSAADIRDMSGMNLTYYGGILSGFGYHQRHQLLVDGNAGDSVVASGAWINAGTFSSGSQTYRVYNAADTAAQLIVDSDISATIDLAPYLTGTAPTDNGTAVLIGSNIVLTFSETVTAGTGDIVISNGTDTRTIAITDTTQVTISGNTVTLNPLADLQSNSHYNVQLASGVITDANGNDFAGINTATALDFDTQDLIAPTLISSAPGDNATAVLVGSNIVLTFSETVRAGVGEIVISNGTDTRSLSVTNTNLVTFNGNKVTINAINDLQAYSHYSVQMASGVITDVAGVHFAGITTGTDLDFDTGGATVDLSAVAAGIDGFVINGQSYGNNSGRSVSGAGDVNGDGFADLIVGAPGASAADQYAGHSYVVFGKKTAAAVNLSAVAAGSGGFVIYGQAASDQSGSSVSSAGDVNGDGLADLLVGVPAGDPSAGSSAGRSYVVFGKTDSSAVDLSAVAAGAGGFVINGQALSDFSGQSVSGAGDVNGDGLSDLIVGAYGSDPSEGISAGRSYVVFGKTDGTAVNLSAVTAGTGGFVINGQAASDLSGMSVSAAGDVNGDGLADLIVGAYTSDPSAGADAGRSYVVFGKTDNTGVDLLAVSFGFGGFVINGQATSAYSGSSVSNAGDVNGDGLADLLVGASGSDPSAGTDAGRSYVVFGKTAGSAVNLSAVAAGVGGFVINGQAASDRSGNCVSSVGDMNGDGLADLLVGASHRDLATGYTTGRSYVVFGKSGGDAVDLSAIAAGVGGFLISEQLAASYSGRSVSGAGDVNGDGLADLIVGAANHSLVAGNAAGRSYVIFGSTAGVFAQTTVDQYGTTGADSFTDNGTAQTLVTGQGADTLTATAASILYGGAGKDLFVIDAAMITALQSAMGTGGNTNHLARIDGGTGIDTLSLSGSGLTLDLTQVANQAGSNPDGGSRIDSIEKIDLTGSGNNTLILQLRDVLDMGSANLFATTGRQQLLVTGDSGDTLNFADATGTTNWTQSGTQTISSVTYNVWNHDSALATVYVNPNVVVI